MMLDLFEYVRASITHKLTQETFFTDKMVMALESEILGQKVTLNSTIGFK
jgi:hypothetical protein